MWAPVDFEWDDAKACANETKHAVRFEYAARVFEDPARLDIDTTRPVDGEARRKCVGMIDSRIFTVVYVLRGEICRLISARRANSKEGRTYGHG